MAFRNTPETFGSVSKALHWVISPLVILMLIAGFFMQDISDVSLRGSVFNVHKLTGIAILFLMLVRLAWALSNPKPRSPRGTSRIEHLAEWGGHALLYVLVIAQPLCGWVGSVAAGHPPHLGQLVLQLPVAESKGVAQVCFQMHTVLAWALIVMIVLHVLAALYHHYIRKDNVLRRMMPGG